MNVTTHVIIGTLPTFAELSVASLDRSTPTILPPHPYATRTPFYTHPTSSMLGKKPKKLTFKDNIEISTDPIVAKKYLAKGGKGPDNEGGFDDATCKLQIIPDILINHSPLRARVSPSG